MAVVEEQEPNEYAIASNVEVMNVKEKAGGRFVRIRVRIVEGWSVRDGIVRDRIGLVRMLGRRRGLLVLLLLEGILVWVSCLGCLGVFFGELVVIESER